MGKKLDIVLEVQNPKRENNSFLDFYIVSGEILISDNWKGFTPCILVNGEEYTECFFENLIVVADTKENDWPERLSFRLIWDKENKKKLKGITAYYDFLIFRKDGYCPWAGLSIEEAMKQVVHFELEEKS